MHHTHLLALVVCVLVGLAAGRPSPDAAVKPIPAFEYHGKGCVGEDDGGVVPSALHDLTCAKGDQFPCAVTIPNWSTAPLHFPSSNVSFISQAANGKVHWYLGPDPDHYWSNCCGSDGKSSCHVDDSDHFLYNFTCVGAGKDMYLSMKSHNLIECDVVVTSTYVRTLVDGFPVTVPCTDAGKTTDMCPGGSEAEGEWNVEPWPARPSPAFPALPIPQDTDERPPPSDGGQMHCYKQFVCVATPPNYSLGYVEFPNSAVHVNASAQNGKMHYYLGPDPDHYWTNCCGPDGNSSCHWDDQSNMTYTGTCNPTNTTKFYVSMKSHNYIEADPVILDTTFSFAGKQAPCNIEPTTAAEYCPL